MKIISGAILTEELHVPSQIHNRVQASAKPHQPQPTFPLRCNEYTSTQGYSLATEMPIYQSW